MKLLVSFILLVGTVMVSTNEIIQNIHYITRDVSYVNKTDIYKWAMVASIWIKDTTENSIIAKLSCTGVIITEKHILTQQNCVGNSPIENIRVAYGIQDTKNIDFGELHTPKKLSQTVTEPGWAYSEILEMDTINFTEFVQPACISPSFNFTDKTLTVTGFSSILGQMKTFDTSLVNITNCGWSGIHPDFICHSPNANESNIEKLSPGSPIQWFNPDNKIWILVGMEGGQAENNSTFMKGYNIPFFYQPINKIVQDASSNLTTC